LGQSRLKRKEGCTQRRSPTGGKVQSHANAIFSKGSHAARAVTREPRPKSREKEKAPPIGGAFQFQVSLFQVREGSAHQPKPMLTPSRTPIGLSLVKNEEASSSVPEELTDLYCGPMKKSTM